MEGGWVQVSNSHFYEKFSMLQDATVSNFVMCKVWLIGSTSRPLLGREDPRLFQREHPVLRV